MKKILLFIFLVSLWLTGCSNNADMEDRNYTLVLGIDQEGEELRVSYSFANLATLNGTSGSEGKSITSTVSASNLLKAKEQNALNSDKTIEFGHLKAIIFADKLLHDKKKMSAVLDYIEKDEEFAKTILVYSTKGKPEDIINTDKEVTGLLGDYLKNISLNNLVKKEKNQVSIGDILSNQQSGEGCIGIPNLGITEKKPYVSSYTLVQDGMKVGELTPYEYNLAGLARAYTPYLSFSTKEGYVKILSVNVDKTIKNSSDCVQLTLRLKGKATSMDDINEKSFNKWVKKNLQRQLLDMKSKGIDYLGITQLLIENDQELWKLYRDKPKELLEDLKVVVESNFEVE